MRPPQHWPICAANSFLSQSCLNCLKLAFTHFFVHLFLTDSICSSTFTSSNHCLNITQEINNNPPIGCNSTSSLPALLSFTSAPTLPTSTGPEAPPSFSFSPFSSSFLSLSFPPDPAPHSPTPPLHPNFLPPPLHCSSRPPPPPSTQVGQTSGLRLAIL